MEPAHIVSCLLDYGADIESLDPDRQTTPLRYAILRCKTDVIPLLLSRGASNALIVENGTSALDLVREAAAGAFESYDDLPRKEQYTAVVELRISMGV